MNVGFVTQSKELLMPRFDKILSVCTANRVLTLAEQLVADGRLSWISSRNVSVQEGKAADEMMLIWWYSCQTCCSAKKAQLLKRFSTSFLRIMRCGPPLVRMPVSY
uniref:Uncharacterized protein n=1 Tax=Oryza punctata TaxID=4537 RepID=A0A0E0JYC1_ORYPU